MIERDGRSRRIDRRSTAASARSSRITSMRIKGLGSGSHQPRHPRGPIESRCRRCCCRRRLILVTSRATRAALLKVVSVEHCCDSQDKCHQPRHPRGPIESRWAPIPDVTELVRHQPRHPRGPIERSRPARIPRRWPLAVTSRATRAALLKGCAARDFRAAIASPAAPPARPY